MLLRMDEAISVDSEKETSDFYKALDNIEHLKYLTVIGDGHLPVLDFKGDSKFYTGYYYNGTDLPCVFTLDCGPTFHKAEDYRIIEGRDFTDEDMIYVEGKPRPVLLGYKYKGIYKPGDIIKIEYGKKHNLTFEEIEQNINMAVALENKSIYYLMLSYIRYDYYARKCYVVTPNYIDYYKRRYIFNR